MIPDSSYAALYAETIDHCREHGAFDPATMGTTPNVGLMAQKAEEYGSHDKTFEIAAAGTVRVVDRVGRDAARARRRGRRHLARAARPRTRRSPTGCGSPSSARARDRRARPCSGSTRPARTTPRCSPKVARYLAEHDTDGLQIEILPVAEATRFTLERARARRGHDLGHRQRAARLPHRPVPDPRARHEREDALDRPAHERRRPVRDRRRRLGAQARAAAREGEPPALGLARRVPRARRVARDARRQGRQRARRRSSRRTLDAATGTLLENGQVAVAQGRRARQPRQPLLPRAATGRRRWRRRTRTPALAEAFAPLAERLAADEDDDRRRARRGRRASRSTSAATTTSTATRRPRSMRPSATFNAAIASLTSAA